MLSILAAILLAVPTGDTNKTEQFTGNVKITGQAVTSQGTAHAPEDADTTVDFNAGNVQTIRAGKVF